MRSFTWMASGMLACGLAGAGVALLAQGAMKPGHERVPPYREPSPYMSAAEIQTELSKLDPKLVASRTGGAFDFAKGKAVGVVRRRMTGPQFAITHPRTVEYMMVIKGTATLVTGGTLIPPTIDSDPYPNTNPNATIRSDVGSQGWPGPKDWPRRCRGEPSRNTALAQSDRRRDRLLRDPDSEHGSCAWDRTC